MDVNEHISAIELRARIFSTKSRIVELKEDRKKTHLYIKKAKILIKNIERSIDCKHNNEFVNYEVQSVVSYLKSLREKLIELDHYWQIETEHCAKLHEKLDVLNERVYVGQT